MRAIPLLVPHLEALELPIFVERANMQKPHAEYEYSYSTTLTCCAERNIHILKASTVCYILDEDSKFSRFQGVKKERFSKRDSLCPQPARLTPDRGFCGRSAPQSYKEFFIQQIFMRNLKFCH